MLPSGFGDLKAIQLGLQLLEVIQDGLYGLRHACGGLQLDFVVGDSIQAHVDKLTSERASKRRQA